MSLACSEHAGSCLTTTTGKGRQEFCEKKASIFVLDIILSMNTANNQKAQKQV